jgi:hypothetical protein
MFRPVRTTHCLALDSDGALACATVVDTPLGARATLVERIDGALELPAPRLADRLPKIRRSDALVVVCPSEMVSARPFAISAKSWPGAREDIIASVETLFPLTPDDARVGLLDMAPDDLATDAERACLLAVSAHALRPWLEHLRAALGRAPDCVLAPTH